MFLLDHPRSCVWIWYSSYIQNEMRQNCKTSCDKLHMRTKRAFGILLHAFNNCHSRLSAGDEHEHGILGDMVTHDPRVGSVGRLHVCGAWVDRGIVNLVSEIINPPKIDDGSGIVRKHEKSLDLTVDRFDIPLRLQLDGCASIFE